MKYNLISDGCVFLTVDADSLEDACDVARESDTSCYDTSYGTVWVDIHVVNVDDLDDCATVTQTVDPPAPSCSEGEHAWRSPEWLGGCAENPGVWGHGGGVILTEVCQHCGAYRVTDTWAQRRDTGEQGLCSVSYREPDERSLLWVEEEA